ncbi:MAG: transglycosylase SLT domain-containing protein, partial [Candidatus Omnitrophota bacterium]
RQRLEKMISDDLREVNLNVPPEFVMCIIKKESNFKPEALNDRGEYSVGLMQLNKRSGTDRAALSGLKKYGRNLYQKLLNNHGSDSKITDTSSLMSKNDPASEKGMTNIALGIAYLKKINAENGRGNGLRNDTDLDNLAAGYNCGPARCKGGRTAYSNDVVACTRTMRAKSGSSSGFK